MGMWFAPTWLRQVSPPSASQNHFNHWFIEANDDGGGGDNWSYESCKAPVKSSRPTNQHPVFLQAGCPSCHPTNSVKALMGKISHPMDWLTAYPKLTWGSSNFVSDH